MVQSARFSEILTWIFYNSRRQYFLCEFSLCEFQSQLSDHGHRKINEAKWNLGSVRTKPMQRFLQLYVGGSREMSRGIAMCFCLRLPG